MPEEERPPLAAVGPKVVKKRARSSEHSSVSFTQLSAYLNYYEEGALEASCKLCSKEGKHSMLTIRSQNPDGSYRVNSSPMRLHIRAIHPDVWDLLIHPGKEQKWDVDGLYRNTAEIMRPSPPLTGQEYHLVWQLLGLWVADTSTPFSHLDHPIFRLLSEKYFNVLPGRAMDIISRLQDSLIESLDALDRKFIAESPYFAVSSDHWCCSMHNQRRYLSNNVYVWDPHHHKVERRLISLRLVNSEHGEESVKLYKLAFQKFGILDADADLDKPLAVPKLAGFTCDNALSHVSTEQYWAGGVSFSGCFAHTLQLAVNGCIEENERLASAMDVMRKISTKTGTIEGKKLTGGATVYGDVVTRWSSSFKLILDLYRKWDAIVPKLRQEGEKDGPVHSRGVRPASLQGFWNDELKEMARCFLLVFRMAEQCTAISGAVNASLSVVIPLLSVLLNDLDPSAWDKTETVNMGKVDVGVRDPGNETLRALAASLSQWIRRYFLWPSGNAEKALRSSFLGRQPWNGFDLPITPLPPKQKKPLTGLPAGNKEVLNTYPLMDAMYAFLLDKRFVDFQGINFHILRRLRYLHFLEDVDVPNCPLPCPHPFPEDVPSTDIALERDMRNRVLLRLFGLTPSMQQGCVALPFLICSRDIQKATSEDPKTITYKALDVVIKEQGVQPVMHDPDSDPLPIKYAVRPAAAVHDERIWSNVTIILNKRRRRLRASIVENQERIRCSRDLLLQCVNFK